jgi:hypothetical protein
MQHTVAVRRTVPAAVTFGAVACGDGLASRRFATAQAPGRPTTMTSSMFASVRSEHHLHAAARPAAASIAPAENPRKGFVNLSTPGRRPPWWTDGDQLAVVVAIPFWCGSRSSPFAQKVWAVPEDANLPIFRFP